MFTRTLDKALPQEHIAKIYDSLSRQDSVITVQLRTGHLGLNSYMARIQSADTTRCECGADEESVRHFLFQCPQWMGPRQTLQGVLWDRRGDLSYALGGWSGRMDTRTVKLIDGSEEKWKPDIGVIRAVIQLVKATEVAIMDDRESRRGVEERGAMRKERKEVGEKSSNAGISKLDWLPLASS
jgi:hypothetical protein